MPDGTYQAFCRDITERKQAEAERLRLVAILEATSDLVSIASPDGRVQYMNRAGRTMLGLGPDEDATNLRVAESHPESCRRRILEEAFPAAARNGIWNGETVFLSRDGREVPMLQVILAHKTSQGDVEFYSTIARDISDRQEMERRLRQAEKMEAVGQLAGGIAHDFNNQLAGIMGYADILGHLLTDPNLRGYAENIITTARRAADLTRNLLTFSRRGTFLAAPTDVHELIREVVRLLSHTIDRRIAIQQCLNAKPSVVVGDPTQLQNALLNMAVNARDAMPNGGTMAFTTNSATLDKESCRHLGGDVTPGQYLQINVADTGVGMDKETLKHIFEPFFTTKAPGKGTGMGLASVYGAVKSHKGAINVYSEPGRGAVFKLYLPQEGALRSTSDATASATAVAKGSGRILIVDDEEVVRSFSTEALTRLGYQVTSCADGGEATRHYRSAWRETDLVILDVVMPTMGGKETFAALREINPAAKILLSSGYIMNSESDSLLASGASGFIQKPFQVAELSRAVADAIGLPAQTNEGH
jgi:PAS domain S-box-containing protein